MLLAGAAVAGSFLASTRLNAETRSDRKWINQCIVDNKGAKDVSQDVIVKYCTCMNDAMDDDENRTITQFEKANPKIRAKCDRESGWK